MIPPSRADELPPTRAALRAAAGVLLVLRAPPLFVPTPPGQPAAVPPDVAEGDEPLVAVWDDGSVTAFHGHVDLGTGLATALAQIVAEELDADVAAVRVCLGSTALGPNQGATIASASIQVHAEPLRLAAAQARAWLMAETEAKLGGCAVGDAVVAPVARRAAMEAAGLLPGANGNAEAAFVARPLAAFDRPLASFDLPRLLAGRHVELLLAPDTMPKDPSTYTVVGTDQPRIDLPAKARGELVYVHDMRVPGMLHGRVVRPPYAGLDAGDFVGNTLRAVDEASIGHLPGLRAIVVIRDFVGVVAEREEVAERAMRELKVDWGDFAPPAPLDDLARALRRQPSTRRVLVDEGDVDGALAGCARPLDREYVWPYQLHASIGPSCALAAWHGPASAGGHGGGAAGDGASPAAAGSAAPVLTVWAGTQNPHVLRADLAKLLQLADPAVEVVRMEAAGCYGRNGADDVAADAALLARAVGAPVRVQLTRAQEHLWEPKGAAQLMRVAGGLDAEGRPVAYDFSTAYPSNGAPTLALLLTRTIEPEHQAYAMGDRTAVPPYAYPALRVVADDMAPILRASWLRGVSALPNSFAHESFVDELAAEAGVDPVQYRLGLLRDRRAIELVEATAARAGWVARRGPRRGQVPASPGDGRGDSQRDDQRDGQRDSQRDGQRDDQRDDQRNDRRDDQRNDQRNDQRGGHRHGHRDDQRGGPVDRGPRATGHDRVGDPGSEDPRAAGSPNRVRGQGFAYARYVHGPFPGQGAAWAAWVAEVEVDRATGEVHVERIVVGHDAGRMINPAGVLHQVHGNVLQTTSRALYESLPLAPATQLPAAREWGAYPILSFREVPVVEVLTMPRPGEPPLGAGESASVPGTAAIANAIYDATGVRLRRPPFTPEVVRAALAEEASGASGDGASLPRADGAVPEPTPAPRVEHVAPAPSGVRPRTRGEADRAALPPPAARAAPEDAPWPRRRGLWATLGALVAGAVGFGTALVGGRGAIAPIAPGSTAGVYSAQAIEQGRILAAAGNCVGCHTAPGGVPNAGGRALATPFGTVYATNLTPDPATGIGRWSYPAFARAMREGVSRDGHHLYPAFPYTAFTRVGDADLTALYAYLMAQPPVASAVPPTKLAFPFNLRPLLAGWNALNLAPGPVEPVGSRSAAWNRGAYLVDGLGHCGACHTPRDAFGAERRGSAYLAGAMVDGWEAPALTALGRSPLPWREEDLYDYLRRGHSARHGSAGGPMAPVVQRLQEVPDADVRAMAVYLASFNPDPAAGPDRTGSTAAFSSAPPLAGAPAPEAPAAPAPPGRAREAASPSAIQRFYTTACGACHHDGDGPVLLGQNIPLALNTNLHSDRPDNLLRVILDGIREPATRELGFMPGFREHLDDSQMAKLAAYLRGRFAPDKPAWRDLDRAVARVRGWDQT